MIRPFNEGDIARVAELRRLCFRHSVWEHDAALRAALQRVFFENPWLGQATCAPGFVAEGATGEVIGFVGLVPRRAVYQGQRISAAVASQLMVHPGHRSGRVSLRLVQAVADAGADLLLTDSITDKALRLWRKVGGSLSPATRLHWQVGGWKHIVRRTLRRTSWATRSDTGTDTGPLDWSTAEQALSVDLPEDAVMPVMDAESMMWLEARTVERYGDSSFKKAAVTEQGRLLGWFAYLLREREAQVLQVIGLAGAHDIVFRHLLNHSGRRGARMLRGRYQTSLIHAVAEAKGVYQHRGNGLAFLTRDPDLFRAIMEDRTWISGFDGEWWMPF